MTSRVGTNASLKLLRLYIWPAVLIGSLILHIVSVCTRLYTVQMHERRDHVYHGLIRYWRSKIYTFKTRSLTHHAYARDRRHIDTHIGPSRHAARVDDVTNDTWPSRLTHIACVCCLWCSVCVLCTYVWFHGRMLVKCIWQRGAASMQCIWARTTHDGYQLGKVCNKISFIHVKHARCRIQAERNASFNYFKCSVIK